MSEQKKLYSKSQLKELQDVRKMFADIPGELWTKTYLINPKADQCCALGHYHRETECNGSYEDFRDLQNSISKVNEINIPLNTMTKSIACDLVGGHNPVPIWQVNDGMTSILRKMHRQYLIRLSNYDLAYPKDRVLAYMDGLIVALKKRLNEQ